MRTKAYHAGASSSAAPITPDPTATPAEIPPTTTATPTQAATPLMATATTTAATTTTASNVDEGAQPMDTDDRTHREGKQPVDEGKEDREKKQPPTHRLPSPDLDDGDDGGDDDDDDGDDEEEDEDDDDFDVNKLEDEVEDRVRWEVHHRLEAVKRTAVVNAQRKFSAASKDVQYNIFDKMESEGREAEQHINNLAYQQNAMRKAMTGMLELSMATMYKGAMSKAVEADFQNAVRDYYAKSINMVKRWKEDVISRDHYRKEGKRQNELVKQLLGAQTKISGNLQEMERKWQAAEEARLSSQELYEIARDEAHDALKAQGALERIIENMEAEQHPQRMRMQELEGELQLRNQAYAALDKNYSSLQADHGAINTLLQLSRSQLDASVQANKVLEARVSSAGSSYSGSTSKEHELEQQLSLQKTLVDAP